MSNLTSFTKFFHDAESRAVRIILSAKIKLASVVRFISLNDSILFAILVFMSRLSVLKPPASVKERSLITMLTESLIMLRSLTFAFISDRMRFLKFTRPGAVPDVSDLLERR